MSDHDLDKLGDEESMEFDLDGNPIGKKKKKKGDKDGEMVEEIRKKTVLEWRKRDRSLGGSNNSSSRTSSGGNHNGMKKMLKKVGSKKKGKSGTTGPGTASILTNMKGERAALLANDLSQAAGKFGCSSSSSKQQQAKCILNALDLFPGGNQWNNFGAVFTWNLNGRIQNANREAVGWALSESIRRYLMKRGGKGFAA